MMNKKWIMLSAVMALMVTTKVVLADTVLPRVTTACETKIGGALLVANDGFSSLKSCPGQSRQVVLGEAPSSNGGGSTGGGSVIGPGKVAYVNSQFVLMQDGTIKQFDAVLRGWRDWMTLPSGVTANDVLQFGGNTFMTKSGKVYTEIYDSATSTNIWLEAIDIE